MADYTLTVRSGARVQREGFGALEDALDAMERLGREVEGSASAAPAGGRLMRRLEPVQLVVARLELAGPKRLRAGVDVRGDGSSEGYTGRVKRQLVQQRRGESAYDALRRSLEGTP